MKVTATNPVSYYGRIDPQDNCIVGYVYIKVGNPPQYAAPVYQLKSEPGDSYGDIHAAVTNMVAILDASQGVGVAARLDE